MVSWMTQNALDNSESIPSFQQKAELNLQLSIQPLQLDIQCGLLGKFAIFVYQISVAHAGNI